MVVATARTKSNEVKVLKLRLNCSQPKITLQPLNFPLNEKLFNLYLRYHLFRTTSFSLKLIEFGRVFFVTSLYEGNADK